MYFSTKWKIYLRTEELSPLINFFSRLIVQKHISKYIFKNVFKYILYILKCINRNYIFIYYVYYIWYKYHICFILYIYIKTTNADSLIKQATFSCYTKISLGFCIVHF